MGEKRYQERQKLGKKEKTTKAIKRRSRFLAGTITSESFSSKMQFYECVNKVHTPLSQLISHKLENSNELLKVSLIKNPPCRILFGELQFPVNIYQAPVSAPAEVCSSVKRD